MRWSQLKKRLEGNFCERAQGRVEIFQTRYRHAHDQEGEAWITLDKKRILSRGSESYLKEQAQLVHTQREKGESWAEAYSKVWPVLAESENILLEQLNNDLFSSLNLPLSKIITHKNPIIRALGMIDRRLGSRSLKKLDVSHEHPFVRALYALRCSSDDPRPVPADSPV